MLVLTMHHRDTDAVLSHWVMSRIQVLYLVAQSCLTLCYPLDCSPPGSSAHGDSPGKNTDWSVFPCLPPGDLPNPVIEAGSLTLQADSLPTEQAEKPNNPGVGSLSLLQGIFPTQESNWGLLHYKRILYQLSYQRSLRDTGQGTNLWSSLLICQCHVLGFDFNGTFCSFKRYIGKIANGIQQILNLLQVLF